MEERNQNKTAYLCGHITTDEDDRKKFQDGLARLERDGYRTVLSAAILPRSLSGEAIFHIACAMIDAADDVYLMPDRRSSDMSDAEWYHALMAGKKVRNLDSGENTASTPGKSGAGKRFTSPIFRGPTTEELEKINRRNGSRLKADEVTIFHAELASTRIDGDFKRMTAKTLSQMKERVIGKRVIAKNKRENRSVYGIAFAADVLKHGGERFLIVRAYFLRRGLDLIGLSDEAVPAVNSSFSIRWRICSVCGKNFDACPHEKGERYNGEMCHVNLSGLEDVLEIKAEF